MILCDPAAERAVLAGICSHGESTYLDIADNILLKLPEIENYVSLKYFDITNNDTLQLTNDDIEKLKFFKSKIKKCHIDQIELDINIENKDEIDDIDDSLDDSSINIILSDTSNDSSKSSDSSNIIKLKVNLPDKVPINTKRSYNL
jgi:hypothetical protein